MNKHMRQVSGYRQKYRKEIALSRIHAPGPHDFIFVLDSLKPGFNIGKIFRTGNAFGVSEIHLINIGMFDPNPSKGTVKHTKTRSFDTFDSNYRWLVENGFSIYVFDMRGGNTLGSTVFPRKSAFVFGHEEYGFSFNPNEFPEVQTVSIKQFGVVESLNVSVAASLAGFEYLRQHELKGQ
ncbi:MAG: TrmH family RNA methyltransferase [Oligoflexia bacterium]|nr:TrmH family RNA methyltransferase [Oligoflexia bacterium]